MEFDDLPSDESPYDESLSDEFPSDEFPSDELPFDESTSEDTGDEESLLDLRLENLKGVGPKTVDKITKGGIDSILGSAAASPQLEWTSDDPDYRGDADGRLSGRNR